jgi:hypothetical protein
MTPCAEPARATRTKNEATVVVKPTITAADLAFHNKPDDVWIAIDGKVFDLTKWASLHPGDFRRIRRVLLNIFSYRTSITFEIMKALSFSRRWPYAQVVSTCYTAQQAKMQLQFSTRFTQASLT